MRATVEGRCTILSEVAQAESSATDVHWNQPFTCRQYLSFSRVILVQSGFANSSVYQGCTNLMSSLHQPRQLPQIEDTDISLQLGTPINSSLTDAPNQGWKPHLMLIHAGPVFHNPTVKHSGTVAVLQALFTQNQNCTELPEVPLEPLLSFHNVSSPARLGRW